jgi:hypothetical protein
MPNGADMRRTSAVRAMGPGHGRRSRARGLWHAISGDSRQYFFTLDIHRVAALSTPVSRKYNKPDHAVRLVAGITTYSPQSE